SVVLFWSLQARWGIYALAAGTMLGFALECLLLAAAMIRFGLLPLPKLGEWDSGLSHVGWQYLIVALGALLMNSATVVDQAMAAGSGGGHVSILLYANKIVALVLTLVAVSLSTVLFPRVSRMIAAGHWTQLRRTIRGYAIL